MTETFTLRFLENERYDLNTDCDMVKLMAITPVGTWHSDVPREGLKVRREAFKQYVLSSIAAGLPPSEVILG